MVVEFNVGRIGNPSYKHVFFAVFDSAVAAMIHRRLTF
jgi:hypothetical protein